ncbi:Alpha-N-acetylgalactosaminidase [Petrimonas mucosa]|uniref:Alpha-N-acetylgalactosaminidase n=2 Tax=Petrimonas mucosa TaxID=1642646 RepID=A0A1G4G6C3_9BACT|nr:Alpha-N-acetylgalactosaminidase [Petrimonas mucosa]
MSHILKNKIRIGIVGAQFGAGFQFHIHPNSVVQAVSDLSAYGRMHLQKVYNCHRAYESLEELLKDKEIDAVFIATPPHMHANHVIKALKAGKHVLSAVPLALKLEDCIEVLSMVEKTGLKYMLAETSFYRQITITARKFYNQKLFGKIFSTTAEYSHPGMEEFFFENGKPTWRHGLPPMYYPTHCISFLTGVTGERLVSVSCLGWGDDSVKLKNNSYNNPFWNEKALFRTNNDTNLTVTINWKGALKNVETACWEGDKMSLYFEDSENKMTIIKNSNEIGLDDGGFKNYKNIVEKQDQILWWKTEMLPENLRMDSGHGGSHCFITHEFIDSILNDREPKIDIYEALACTVPGIIAHESAIKGGETLKIPLFNEKNVSSE